MEAWLCEKGINSETATDTGSAHFSKSVFDVYIWLASDGIASRCQEIHKPTHGSPESYRIRSSANEMDTIEAQIGPIFLDRGDMKTLAST